MLTKILKIISYYLVPICLLTISWLRPYPSIFATFGNIALYIVVFILFLKPVAKISGIKKLNRWLIYRRQFGVASVWFFVFHASGMWYALQLKNIYLYFNPQLNLLYGLLAAIGMTILGLTSNDWAVKTLKRNWKRIHYLAYPTMLLILYHAGIAENELGNFYALSVLFIILKILEWKKIL